ncbi:DUF3859 domain-containing protein [Jannaschia aquimarina]|uniref:DUF3859 domain-containing protein n=1 Tax=Jannaschia aquimarina TaxID=935700 RepID=A0A0D1CTA5_9RHOB|nr:DUF3859 domain-containing protein [Jannaschia aquimarina]KIT18002.1 hypothetical protein jaqu_02290 [Jannaschia aquimarina]SNS88308.1 protein of unknown function [Jannaschia aquimarina]
MRHRLILATLLACAASLPAQAKVRLVEAGIVCPNDRESAGYRDAPDTEAGRIDLIAEQIEFDLYDRTVPAMEHLSFGFRVQLKADQPETEVTIVVEHPPFGERQVALEQWTQTLVGGESSLNLFTFDYPYEMVPGRWTFSIEIAGQRQVEVPFVVGDRFANANVDQTCLGNLSS